MVSGMRRATEPDDPAADAPPPIDHVRPVAGSIRLRWSEMVLLLGIGDVFALSAALGLAIASWSFLPLDFVPGPNLPLWFGGSLFIWLFGLRLFDGYDIVAPTFWRSTLASVSRAFVLVLIVTTGVFFFLPFLFPRGVGVVAPILGFGALVGWRSLFARLVRRAELARRVIFLGADEANRRLAELLMRSRSGVSYRPMAFLSGRSESHSELCPLRDPRTPRR